MTVRTTLFFRHPSNPEIEIAPTTITVSADENDQPIIVNMTGGSLPSAGTFAGFAKREGTPRTSDEVIGRDEFLANPGMTVERVVGWHVRVRDAFSEADHCSTYPYPITGSTVELVADVVDREIPTEDQGIAAVEVLRQGIELGGDGEVVAGMELVSSAYPTIEALLAPKAWDRKRARRYVLNVCGSQELEDAFNVDAAVDMMFAEAGGSWDIKDLGLERLDVLLERCRLVESDGV